MGVENWKPVVGYAVLYEVSDQGHVRRIAPGKGARQGHILKGHRVGRGYRMVTLYCGDGLKSKQECYVHRLVAAAFISPCPVGKEVNHRNGNPADNRLTNLEYVTHAENGRHARRVLRRSIGSARKQAKLCEADIPIIRQLVGTGSSQRSVGRRFGVTHEVIRDILSGKSWAHVELA